MMKNKLGVAMLALTLASMGPMAATVYAQEAVVAAPNKEELFTSSDPQLHANKQVVYHIIRDLLEANHWELADQYLTERYLQHNPNVPSGRDTVVNFFTRVLKAEPKPIPETMQTPVAFVTAEGDLVTVATVSTVPDPKDPTKTYTTTWYDTWRIVDGKADEHWDSALKQ